MQDLTPTGREHKMHIKYNDLLAFDISEYLFNKKTIQINIILELNGAIDEMATHTMWLAFTCYLI